MSEANPTPMDADEAYQALLDMIVANEPSDQDDIQWYRIAHSFSTTPPNQRHINILVEAVSNQLLGELTDTLCRSFMQNRNNVGDLVTGLFQDHTAMIAALPQRTLDLRATSGVAFGEIVRRMIWERWEVRDAVPPWDAVHASREVDLAGERRMLLEGVEFLCDEGSREM
jgi:hypothetical protein